MLLSCQLLLSQKTKPKLQTKLTDKISVNDIMSVIDDGVKA